MKTKVGIITALPRESKTVAKTSLNAGGFSSPNEQLTICCSGIGEVNALNAAKKLVNDRKCNFLISWGSAASLRNDIEPGTLLLPDCVVDDRGNEFHIPEIPLRMIEEILKNKITWLTRKHSHVNHMLKTAQDKFELAEKHQSVSADMESVSIAEFAQKIEVPFIIIRSVSDSPAVEIPDSVTKYFNADGTIDFWNFIFSLFINPLQIPEIYRLANGFGKAASTLEKTAALLFPAILKKLDNASEFAGKKIGNET